MAGKSKVRPIVFEVELESDLKVQDLRLRIREAICAIPGLRLRQISRGNVVQTER